MAGLDRAVKTQLRFIFKLGIELQNLPGGGIITQVGRESRVLGGSEQKKNFSFFSYAYEKTTYVRI